MCTIRRNLRSSVNGTRLINIAFFMTDSIEEGQMRMKAEVAVPSPLAHTWHMALAGVDFISSFSAQVVKGWNL